MPMKLLVELLGCHLVPVKDIGQFQLGQKIKKGRIVETHRVGLPRLWLTP